MADPCEVYSEWSDLESEDVIPELGELVNQALESWGFDSVDVVQGDLSDDDVAGEYSSGVIYFDPNHEVFDSPDETLYVAYHEAMHAAFEQAGYEFEPGLFGGEEERIAYSLGKTATQQALEGCESIDPASDSVYDDNYAPPYPFVSNPEE